MIQINIKTKFNHLPAIQASIRPAMSAVVRKTAFDVEGQIKKEMRRSKTGRTYERLAGQGTTKKGTVRKRRGMHRASAPGEAPAVDLGQLINSIQTEHVTDLTSTVGTNVEYAMALEFGTSRIAPRPVWVPVIEKFRPKFVEAIKAVLRSVRGDKGGFTINR